MTLILHRGGTDIDYAGLRELETPAPTASHVPIPHFRVVDLVKTAVGMYGHEVTAEHFGVTEDGMRFVGLLSLKSVMERPDATPKLVKIIDAVCEAA